MGLDLPTLINYSIGEFRPWLPPMVGQFSVVQANIV